MVSQNSTNSVFCDGTWVKLFVYIAQTNLRRASMKRLIVEAEWELVP